MRAAGESVAALAGGLRLMGIEIGHETLRLWLNRELGRKPRGRRKTRATSIASVPPPRSPAGNPVATPVGSSAAPAVEASAPKADHGPEPIKTAPVRQSSLIRPGETPLEAFRRRLAEREAREIAAQAAAKTPDGPKTAGVSTAPS